MKNIHSIATGLLLSLAIVVSVSGAGLFDTETGSQHPGDGLFSGGSTGSHSAGAGLFSGGSSGSQHPGDGLFSGGSTGSLPDPFSGGTSSSGTGGDWFGGGVPDQSQLAEYFSAIGIPYFGSTTDWSSEITIPRADGSTWNPYADLPGPESSWDWGGVNTNPTSTDGWWSPLNPIETPVSPIVTPTQTIPSGNWGVVDDNSVPKVSLTELNLQGDYLKITNRGSTSVSLTGWKITSGQGRSLTFIDWPRGDGSVFTFILYPYTTVTVFYGQEGTVTSTELYWPSGTDVWNNRGDTAYLYDPQGRLVSSITATA